MNLFSYTFKSLRGRITNVIFTVVAIMLAIGLTLSVLTISNSVEEGIKDQAGTYDLIVGAEGSPLQLVLNSLVYLETPTGNISYELYENLTEDDRILRAVPLGLGDSYRGFPIVGTTQDFFLPFREGMAERFFLNEGAWFEHTGEVVVGYEVATTLSLSLGDTFHGNHGLGDGGDAHEDLEYVVVGILSPTGSPDDQAIFTPIESVWEVHDHDEEESAEEHADHTEEETSEEHANHEEEETSEEHASHTEEEAVDEHADHDESEELASENEHAHEEDRQVTAILVKPEQLGFIPLVKQELDDLHEVQAVYPVTIFRQLLETFSAGRSIAILLASVSIVMAALFIVFAVMNSVVQRKKETEILRALGVPRRKLILTNIIETITVSSIGTILGIGLSAVVFLIASTYSREFFGVNLPGGLIDWTSLKYGLYLFVLAIVVSFIPSLWIYSKKVDGKQL
ncbi:ABC transporter permease [Litchfieldia alkalitelluris]|uniref:ABC transporter permease n=1 Tax=Litchfieldia alkalitelluris TaxID=304268 RepID=UPI0009980369|nr:ABC transporter permease [Litchfieldia alkalitelluris]